MPAAASEPKRVLNGCSACGRDFSSVTAFDMHRTGKHEHLASPEHPDGRRCRSDAEMIERSMRLDKNGRWRGPASASPWFAAAGS